MKYTIRTEVRNPFRNGPAYYLPHVCVACKVSFKRSKSDIGHRCPHCRADLIPLNRKFHAPKKTDIEQWEKIAILVKHGFRFYAVYEQIAKGIYCTVAYPKTRKEALEFVKRYNPGHNRRNIADTN